MNKPTGEPEEYFLPIDDAAALGDPETAIISCLQRLNGAIEVFSDSTTSETETPQSELNNFSSLLRGQMATLQYLFNVKSQYIANQKGSP